MNDKLQDLLTGAAAPGIYRLTSRRTPANIAAQAEVRGWRVFHLDGAHVASKNEFLAACAQAMGFPAHFGHNWDALVDSLRDLSWAPAGRGYLVLYDNAGRFAAAQPQEFATAVDILRSSVTSWQEKASPMVVLLRGAGRAAGDVPKL